MLATELQKNDPTKSCHCAMNAQRYAEEIRGRTQENDESLKENRLRNTLLAWVNGLGLLAAIATVLCYLL
jgi:hypothetical protein